jgi:hypothetical protein
VAKEWRERKSEGVAVLLAVLLGGVGLCGIGQMYVGRITRGLVIFFTGLVLEILGWTCVILPSEKDLLRPPVFLLATIIVFGGLTFWIWQIFDARNVCRDHNTKLLRA